MGHTGALPTVHKEGTDNQSGSGPLGQSSYIQRALATSRGEGRLGKEGTNNQTNRSHAMGQTGALPTVHTEGTDNQSDSVPLGHCLLYIQRALATSWGEGRLDKEGTNNQIVHTEWGRLGHCQLDIQRTHTTSCGEETLGTESTYNQTDMGHTQWGTVNCTEDTYNQSDMGILWY